jgi:hypothetical protein
MPRVSQQQQNNSLVISMLQALAIWLVKVPRRAVPQLQFQVKQQPAEAFRVP